MTLHEERLAIFQQLGDVRERAVTLGDVARLKAQGGDVQGARQLLAERLEVNRRLGDMAEIAAALFSIAQLDLAEGQTAEAGSRLAESWPLLVRLNRVDGIAVVGEVYGGLLANQGDAAAIDVLRRSQAAYDRLGQTERAGEIGRIVSDLENRSPG
jgi:hypothetical protein